MLLAPPPIVQPAPVPTVTPDTPVYTGNPAVRFTVEERIEGFDPDGNARVLLIARFFDAQGRPTRILANSDLDWSANRGFVQWQNRMRYRNPAAVVRVNTGGPVLATIHAEKPALGTVTVRFDPCSWSGPRVVAAALGPHLVQIGWFPRATAAVRIVRTGGGRRSAFVMPAGSSSFRDASVVPGARYRYAVTRGGVTAQLAVVTPPEFAATPLSLVSGKGMWLFWSLNPLDDQYYAKLDPAAIVDRAVKAGLHYVELRTTYGSQWMIPPQAKPTIDAIVDGLAAHGIVPIGWSVPRLTSFEDLAASMRSIAYRTAKGTPLRGIALDLERGDDFLGDDPQGLAALWRYERALRETAGPRFLIVATVEDPYFEHLNGAEYPYAKVAQYASALQPMSYWRMMVPGAELSPPSVAAMLRDSYAKLQVLAGRRIPISIGGETSPGPSGYPPAAEITASLQAAKAAGAIGECFFDWDGTQPYQWSAIGAFPWN